MKKLLVIGIIVILLIGLAVSPYVIDDIACERFEREVEEKISAAEGVYLIESVSGCTNTGGTGNHTDLWVAVRIETTRLEDEVKELFPEAYTVQTEEETATMKMLGKRFETIYDGKNTCYTLEFSKSAPCSAFDMRGH